MILAAITFFLSFTDTSSLREEHKKAADKNIEAVLGRGELKYTVTESGKEYYMFESAEGKESATVVFSSAKGRYELFDYMVIIRNQNTEIVDIKILKYRSEYGYEITNKGWLKQFYNKPGIRFDYRKNIDTLSGATFSAQSLVNDINLVLDFLMKGIVMVN
jgi:Na+-translocating ferredoxin:NAD+ oxidoreductase RnfG subunit